MKKKSTLLTEAASVAAAAAVVQAEDGEEDVLWLDAFRNTTITDLDSLRDYIRREGSMYKGQGCMW